MVFAGLGLGAVALAGLGVWLMMGGTNVVLGVLPEGVVKTLGERPGEGKKVEQKLSDYPNEQPGDKGGGPISAEELAPYRESLEAQAALVDAAIDKMRASGGRDQALVHAAEKALDDLKTSSVRDAPTRLQSNLQELRRDLTQERAAALDTATHLVVVEGEGKRAAMRSSANAEAAIVAELEDGVLVRVHLDNGNGWSRADVLSGPSAGKGGYVQNRSLKALPKAPTN
jgi:hypothetical protein